MTRTRAIITGICIGLAATCGAVRERQRQDEVAAMRLRLMDCRKATPPCGTISNPNAFRSTP